MVLPDLNLLYSASGFGVGMLVGLTGVGGGALMTPLLVLLFGIHPATAVGTDLLYASVTKTAGTVVHGLSNTVDWTITRRLAFGSVPATALTLAFLEYFSHRSGEGAGGLVAPELGFALVPPAIALLFRKRLLDFFAARVGEFEPGRAKALTIGLGAVLGIHVSLSSVGAGA